MIVHLSPSPCAITTILYANLLAPRSLSYVHHKIQIHIHIRYNLFVYKFSILL